MKIKKCKTIVCNLFSKQKNAMQKTNFMHKIKEFNKRAWINHTSI